MQISLFKYKHKLLFFCALSIANLIFATQVLKAQVFDSSQNPPGVKWKQINTPNFQIIFPTTFEKEANRMANTLEVIIPKVAESLRKQPKKISIILQNQGTSSNGFVQLAPRRSEYFTTPSQEFDYQDWLNSLAVHELRHVVQFDKLTGNLSAPLFEELALAIFGITLPPWFYEGDAVGIETSLTNAGRGRLPSWELFFRTNTLSGKNFSYSKNYLGSVLDRTPGYYQLGYFMTSKLRRDHGKFIMDSLMSRIANAPFRPYAFSNAVKNYTGLTTRQLHDSTVAELKKLWLRQSAEAKSILYKPINSRVSNVPTDYLLPMPLPGNETLVLKSGKAHPPAFYAIDSNGKERLILRIGYQEVPNLNYADGKIVWDEFRFDKRFQKRSFNVINSYDLISKTYKQLTHKSRLFAPTLSQDGAIIVAVKISLANVISIVELDSETGEILKEYKNPDNLMIQTPAFNQNGTKLVFVAVTAEGQSLFELTRKGGNLFQLIPFQKQQISRPSYAENQIIFRAHYNGLDNLYRFDPVSRKTYQLTSAPFGAFNPVYSPSSTQILFNNYQQSGYDVSSLKYSETSGVEISDIKNTFINYAAPLTRQEGNSNVFDSIPNQFFESRPYREINNLFYFHSLSPIADNLSFNDNPTIGFKLKSNNKLNTLDLYTGYQFNTELNKSEYLAGLTYKRFYPLVDVQFVNRARLGFVRSTTSGTTLITPVSWRENNTELAIRIPFIFNQLNRTYSLGLNLSTSYTARYDVVNRPRNFSLNLAFPMKYQVYLNRNTIRSPQDLAPPWGQNFTVTYQHLPFDKGRRAELLTFRSLFYTPGILNNHSFQTSFNYRIGSGDYRLVNDIPLVSGYNNINPKQELRSTLLFDYRFPLFYPDWELGPLAYIKRFKGGFFADFENVFGNPFSPKTFGAELRADMNLLRFYLPNFELNGKVIFVNAKSVQNPIFETGFTYNF